MNLDSTNARAFNSSLKKAVATITGQKVKVEIINSYKFPHCWVRVHAETTFDNTFRRRVFDACGLNVSTLIDVNDISYGNIRERNISAHVPEWVKVVQG